MSAGDASIPSAHSGAGHETRRGGGVRAKRRSFSFFLFLKLLYKESVLGNVDSVLGRQQGTVGSVVN